MLLKKVFLGLPCPLFPSTAPSSNKRWYSCFSPLRIWPKYLHFLSFIILMNCCFTFKSTKMSSLLLCCWYTFNISSTCIHISSDLILPLVSAFNTQVSEAYNNIDNIYSISLTCNGNWNLNLALFWNSMLPMRPVQHITWWHVLNQW